MQLEELRKQLVDHGQDHVLAHWDTIDDDARLRLAEQIGQIDFALLATLIADDDVKPDFASLARRATSPPSVTALGHGAEWTVDQARQRGEQAIRSGEVAAVLVAGGQGSRLGFDHPKGMFPVGPVSGRTLFQFFADQIIALRDRYGAEIPLYLMTSPATDAETRDYFRRHGHLGLAPESVHIFCQGTMPAVDRRSGKLLLESPSSLALSPDGHGGTVAALDAAGAMQDAVDRGITQLFYFQVDNPLVSICDPTAIGHHLLAESELTTLVIRKRYPDERVGNVVTVDDQVQIIEYSDLPNDVAEQVDPAGNLRLWAGNIAVHVMSVEFLRRAAESNSVLPFHRAIKKVPHVDSDGNRVVTEEPNAIKFERFIFDLLPSAKNAFVVEVAASDAFAPVKNADGAETDTPKLAKQAIADLHRRWLAEAGVPVADSVTVEINPRYALGPSELEKRRDLPAKIDADTYLDLPKA